MNYIQNELCIFNLFYDGRVKYIVLKRALSAFEVKQKVKYLVVRLEDANALIKVKNALKVVVGECLELLWIFFIV